MLIARPAEVCGSAGVPVSGKPEVRAVLVEPFCRLLEVKLSTPLALAPA